MQEHEPSLFTPDITITILTWVCFLIAFFILQKFAFKPIAQSLENRENEIKDSLAKADAIKEQFAQVESEKSKIIDEARSQAAQIIHEARQSARQVAMEIEKKAKEHSDSLVQSAHAQIAGEYQRVSLKIKHDSAQTAIQLAGKILKENMDTDKNKALIQEAIGSI